MIVFEIAHWIVFAAGFFSLGATASILELDDAFDGVVFFGILLLLALAFLRLVGY